MQCMCPFHLAQKNTKNTKTHSLMKSQRKKISHFSSRKIELPIDIGFLDSNNLHWIDFVWKAREQESGESGSGGEGDSMEENPDSEVDGRKRELISNTYRLDTTALFVGKLSSSMKLKGFTGATKAVVGAKLSQPLLSDELMRLYRPLRICFREVSCLPNTPHSYEFLRSMCQPLYVSYHLPFLAEKQSEEEYVGGVEEGQHGWFTTDSFEQQENIALGCGGIRLHFLGKKNERFSMQLFSQWREEGKLKIAVHDRDAEETESFDGLDSFEGQHQQHQDDEEEEEEEKEPERIDLHPTHRYNHHAVGVVDTTALRGHQSTLKDRVPIRAFQCDPNIDAYPFNDKIKAGHYASKGAFVKIEIEMAVDPMLPFKPISDQQQREKEEKGGEEEEEEEEMARLKASDVSTGGVPMNRLILMCPYQGVSCFVRGVLDAVEQRHKQREHEIEDELRAAEEAKKAAEGGGGGGEEDTSSGASKKKKPAAAPPPKKKGGDKGHKQGESEELSPSVTSASLVKCTDVIRGVHFTDGDIRVFFLESEAETLNQFVQELHKIRPRCGEEEHTSHHSTRILHNRLMTFPKLMFPKSFHRVDIKSIVLRDSLNEFKKDVSLYVKGAVSDACRSAMVKLTSLLECDEMKQVVSIGLFPSWEEFVLLEKELGRAFLDVDETGEKPGEENENEKEEKGDRESRRNRGDDRVHMDGELKEERKKLLVFEAALIHSVEDLRDFIGKSVELHGIFVSEQENIELVSHYFGGIDESQDGERKKRLSMVPRTFFKIEEAPDVTLHLHFSSEKLRPKPLKELRYSVRGVLGVQQEDCLVVDVHAIRECGEGVLFTKNQSFERERRERMRQTQLTDFIHHNVMLIGTLQKLQKSAAMKEGRGGGFEEGDDEVGGEGKGEGSVDESFDGPVYTYSTQTLNLGEQQKAVVREEILSRSKSQTGVMAYTMEGNFGILPAYDDKEVARLIERDSESKPKPTRKQALSKKVRIEESRSPAKEPFRTIKARSPKEFRHHDFQLHPARIEELQTPWMEERVREKLEEKESARLEQKLHPRPFDSKAKKPDVFDPSLGVSSQGDLTDDEKFQKRVQDVEEWKSKVVVDDPVFHVSKTSMHHPTDRAKTILRDPPMKESIKRTGVGQEEPLSIFLEEPFVDAVSRPFDETLRTLKLHSGLLVSVGKGKPVDPAKFVSTKDFVRFPNASETGGKIHKRGVKPLTEADRKAAVFN
eukprot:TRINITY_DN1468_c0_g2_i1.p1 TRINITY_DN1468_c0_g2~~TRINITY_DN1468_c0_g2_i1.p1  ORF type:complete len:1221 (-),score=434.82 TRINITY_DN1468_c0_g2_i1:90-3752(-)